MKSEELLWRDASLEIGSLKETVPKDDDGKFDSAKVREALEAHYRDVGIPIPPHVLDRSFQSPAQITFYRPAPVRLSTILARLYVARGHAAIALALALFGGVGAYTTYFYSVVQPAEKALQAKAVAINEQLNTWSQGSDLIRKQLSDLSVKIETLTGEVPDLVAAPIHLRVQQAQQQLQNARTELERYIVEPAPFPLQGDTVQASADAHQHAIDRHRSAFIDLKAKVVEVDTLATEISDLISLTGALHAAEMAYGETKLSQGLNERLKQTILLAKQSLENGNILATRTALSKAEDLLNLQATGQDLSVQLDEVLRAARATNPNEVVQVILSDLQKQGEAAVASADLEAVRNTVARIDSLLPVLSQEITLTLVRPRKPSKVWTEFKGMPYLIVEPRLSNGEVVRVTIKDERDGEEHNVTRLAVGTSRTILDEVRAERIGDGRIARKPVGSLSFEPILPVEQKYITSW